MNKFVYDIPTKVYFGQKQLSHLGEELKKFGSRVLLTYGGVIPGFKPLAQSDIEKIYQMCVE